MADNDLLEIIKLCVVLDITAYKTYLGISQATVDSELKQFWTDMAAEEKSTPVSGTAPSDWPSRTAFRNSSTILRRSWKNCARYSKRSTLS